MSYTQELELAIGAVRQAAQLCRQVQQQTAPESMAKQDKSPVTVADFGSQALICRAIREAFANDPIVAEEDSAALTAPEQASLLQEIVSHVQELKPSANEADVCRWIDEGNATSYSDRFWTLDPIDGTKGFLRGDQYAVALALIVNGEVVVGVLGCPNLSTTEGNGALFAAVRGAGATVQALKPDSKAVPIHVTDTAETGEARFCESMESAHSAHGISAQVAERLGIKKPPVRLDSQAKYAIVARGEADIYLRLPTRVGYREKIWDHAAGMIMVEEAGGQVTDLQGNPLDFTCGSQLERNRGIIVTNGQLHQPLLDEVAAVKQLNE